MPIEGEGGLPAEGEDLRGPPGNNKPPGPLAVTT